MKIKLFGFGAGGVSRVGRVRWALRELGLQYEDVNVLEAKLYGTPELLKISPLGGLPAVEIDGRPLSQSAAICTYLADAHPDKDLIARVGTWERALHEQWSSYALTEVEAWLWHSAKHTMRYPEEKRVKAVLVPNTQEVRESLGPIETHLAHHQYMVADKFSVTDIIMGYSINWARLGGHLADFPNLGKYIDRLMERPACELAKELPRR